MTETVTVTKVNDVYLRIACPGYILHEISDYFTYESKTAKYDKRVRSGKWDGKFRLVDKKTRQLPLGLSHDLEEWCDRSGYQFVDELDQAYPVTYAEIEAWSKTLDLPYTPYDYQIQAVVNVVNNNGRGLIIAPTSAGKSLLQYMICRWFGHKALIIVPTTSLVLQMRGDFISYGYDEPISIIKAGESKDDLEHITVSTWQSLKNVSSNWMNQFGIVIIDEAHGAEAKSIVDLMKKATQVPVRVGATGTLDEEFKTNEMMLRGLFGRKFVAATTIELMQRGITSPLEIQCLQLEYDETFRKRMRKEYNAHLEETREAKRKNEKLPLPFYFTEIDELVGDKDGTKDGLSARHRFVAKLATKLDGNTLVLFKYIRHGRKLYDIIRTLTNREVHFVYGEVSAERRDEIRAIMEANDGVIVVASYATLSTGMNVKNLHNIIFSAPIKGMIKVLQSIGRALRLHATKSTARLFDLGDNFSIGQYRNYAFQHFQKRIEYYIHEKFDYKIVKINLG